MTPKISINTTDKGYGRVIVHSPTLSLHEKLKEMPGKKRWSDGELLFRPSEDNVSWLRQEFPTAEWTGPATIKTAVKHTLNKRPKFCFKTTPYKKQLEVFERSADKKAFAFLMGLATGKTKVGIDTAAFQFCEDLIDGVLILAPNNVHRQWIDGEDSGLPKHLHENVETLTHIWKVGSPAPELFKPSEKLRILSMNIDAIAHASGFEVAERFLKSGRILMIVDESQRIKTPNAGRTKAAIKLGQMAVARRILTGTPIAKGLEDMYSQFRFLDPTILGYNSFFAFRNQYCRMGGYLNKIIVGYRNVDAFHKRIAPYSFSVTIDDMIDLPKDIPLKFVIDLTPEQRQHYDRLREELFTQLDDGSLLETPLAIQKILRLQQIVQGYLPREDGSFQLLKSNRIQAIDDIVESLGGETKVVIWCRFTQDITLLKNHFQESAVIYNGTISAEECDKSKQDFLNEPSIKYFIANQQKGAEGLDGLQKVSSLAIYYSNSFRSLDRWQSEGRTRRPGMNEACRIADIVARNTVDAGILNSLKRKKNISDLSLNELNELVKNG